CSIESSGYLTLVISHSKERCGGRLVIKHVNIYPHITQPSFCPVQAFKILYDYL
ncbi:hypothetical protein BDA99DRAFT_449259, partial [Phascolomyces articulosus]